MENDTDLPDLVPLLGIVLRGRLIASPTGCLKLTTLPPRGKVIFSVLLVRQKQFA